MFFKRKELTVQQIIDGLMSLGQDEFESFSKKIVGKKKLPADLRNPYEWEIHHFIFSSIYLIILGSNEFQKKDEVIEGFFDTFKKSLKNKIPEEAKEYLSIELQIRSKAYNIAFNKEGINGLYKLLSNILLVVETNSDPKYIIDSFIKYAEAKDDDPIKKFYIDLSVPSAHALMKVTDEFNALSQCIRHVLGKFKSSK